MNRLELKNITRSFLVKRGAFNFHPATVKAVNNVSLFLGQQETLGLVGESGCGKSSLARIASGLLQPQSGTIELEGKTLSEWKPVEKAKHIQMIFQDPFSSLNPRLSIGASIAEPLITISKWEGRNLTRQACREEVNKILSQVGLQAEHAKRYPHEFSGGQRQRIAIARALIAGSKTIICDEAVSALDASIQAQVLNLLKDLQEQYRLSYLFISHNLGVIAFMSRRIAVMYLGQIVETADRDRLLNAPAHPYTEILLSSAPSNNPDDRRSKLIEGEMPSPFNPPSGCAFHPRCPYSKKECREQEPPLISLEENHSVRCFNPL